MYPKTQYKHLFLLYALVALTMNKQKHAEAAEIGFHVYVLKYLDSKGDNPVSS